MYSFLVLEPMFLAGFLHSLSIPACTGPEVDFLILLVLEHNFDGKRTWPTHDSWCGYI